MVILVRTPILKDFILKEKNFKSQRQYLVWR